MEFGIANCAVLTLEREKTTESREKWRKLRKTRT